MNKEAKTQNFLKLKNNNKTTNKQRDRQTNTLA